MERSCRQQKLILTLKVRLTTLKRNWLWLCLIFLLLLPAIVLADAAYDGKMYPEDAEYIDLGEEPVSDFDALTAFLDQMPNLRRVDMWGNKMDLASCDMLASRYPNITWGWTLQIRASDHEHLVRTDATSFSTLHNSSSKQHTQEDFRILKYCWNLLALDVGHNNITDLDFLYDLPRLRVLIAACNHLSDITPISALKDLEYAELFKNEIRDISPLTGLPHLLDLNLCFNRIQDFSPIETLTTLQRLWMFSSSSYGKEPNAEVVRSLRAALPDTQIDTVHYSTTGTWRMLTEKKRHPHYDAIVRMFGEDHLHPQFEYVPFEDSFPMSEDPAADLPDTPATPIPEVQATPEPEVQTTPEPEYQSVSEAVEQIISEEEDPAESAGQAQEAVSAFPEPKLLVPQDFSDKGYLLPIDFSTGSKPRKECYTSDFSYEDSTISASVSSGHTGSCSYWVCDIQLTDASQLRTMSASRSGAFDNNNSEMTPENLSTRSSGVVVISGEYWNSSEKRGLGFIMRQGILLGNNLENAAFNSTRVMDVLLIDEDGDFHVLHCPGTDEVPGLINGKRILQAFSFGPILVENGEAIKDFGRACKWIDMVPDQGRQRMCICQTGPLAYKIVCCAGPYRGNPGMTLREFADLVESLGVQTAYNLDGGDSTWLYFNGNKINEFGSTSQRKLRDIIYFASAEQ